MIQRDPKGVFISREQALGAWLPTMLRWLSWNDPIDQALTAIAVFCVNQFGDQCRILGNSADWKEAKDLNATGHFQECRLIEARKWLKRRDALLRCIAEIKAIV